MKAENVPNSYELLKAAGHSPAKASEICLDASRGDQYAADWIALLAQREEKL